MSILGGRKRLEELRDRLREAKGKGAAPQPERLTVREFLRWFDFYRRSRYNVAWMRGSLRRANLRTDPDFEVAWIDQEINIRLDEVDKENADEQQSQSNPTIRITVMAAAHRKPISVKPDDPAKHVITLMDMENIGHLLVMPNERNVKGVVTWRSIATKLSANGDELTANHLMNVNVRVWSIDEPLFEAMDPISKYGFVVIRGKDDTITGLITASDFAQQFAQLARPFLTIGEIEGHLRRIARNRFTAEELRESQHNPGEESEVIGPDDLTLGEYVRLLEEPVRWGKLGLSHIDRANFIERLKWVTEKRNDIMHFDPEGLEPADEERLTTLVEYFRSI